MSSAFDIFADRKRVEGRTSRYGYLCGSDSHDRVDPTNGPPIRNSGSTDLHLLRSDDPMDFTRLHITKNYFRQNLRYRLDDYDCLINLVTDPEQNPGVLAVLARLLKGYRGRVVNRPEAILRCTREKVHKRLTGLEGIVSPPVVHIACAKPAIVETLVRRSRLAFPAILRRTGTHSGNIIRIVDRSKDLFPLLERGKSYNLTSFLDCRSADGLYRKFRFFYFGDQIVIRHMIISDCWNVHSADRERFMAGRPELLEEEQSVMDGGFEGLPPRVRAALSRIGEQVGLDFFGLDCALSDQGDIIVFEANPTMNFFPFSDDPRLSYPRSCLEPSQRSFNALVRGRQGPAAYSDLTKVLY